MRANESRLVKVVSGVMIFIFYIINNEATAPFLVMQQRWHLIVLFIKKRNKDALLFSLLNFPTVTEDTFLCAVHTSVHKNAHLLACITDEITV